MRSKVVTVIIILAVLASAYFFTPRLTQKAEAPLPTNPALPAEQTNQTEAKIQPDAIIQTEPLLPETAPSSASVQTESPSEAEVEKELELLCTIEVECKTILNNMGNLNSDKKELVPTSGVIFAKTSAVFYPGESVFNVLRREMKKAQVHFEFVNTPLYNSVYVEGINNLYEFDCGPLSGWMYSVNGVFPNYGCSRYELCGGDEIKLVYTCDLGRDVGGDYAANKGLYDE
ncbi:MAG: DUF4430 domain-containing protein [Clostridia bacterium]|nr:DUF4430 domain-containing protein [Clostridia bacterium]